MEKNKIVKQEIDLNDSTLRVFINYDWTTDDFHHFFKSITFLYKFYLASYKAISVVADFMSSPKNNHIRRENLLQSAIRNELIPLLNQIRNSENSYYELFIEKSNLPELYLPLPKTLRVRRISYASPGFTDLVGASGILQQLKEILFYYFPNKKEKENLEILKQQKIALQIENLKAVGFSDYEIKELLLKHEKSINVLSNLIEKTMIKKIDLLENID